jgi:hypothetical protein
MNPYDQLPELEKDRLSGLAKKLGISEGDVLVRAIRNQLYIETGLMIGSSYYELHDNGEHTKLRFYNGHITDDF